MRVECNGVHETSFKQNTTVLGTCKEQNIYDQYICLNTKIDDAMMMKGRDSSLLRTKSHLTSTSLFHVSTIASVASTFCKFQFGFFFFSFFPLLQKNDNLGIPLTGRSTIYSSFGNFLYVLLPENFFINCKAGACRRWQLHYYVHKVTDEFCEHCNLSLKRSSICDLDNSHFTSGIPCFYTLSAQDTDGVNKRQ